MSGAGSYQSVANWSSVSGGVIPPDANTQAIIDNGGTAQISSSALAGGLIIGNTLLGASSGASQLVLTGAAQLDNSGFADIGYEDGSLGIINVNSGILNSGSVFRVGTYGNGTMNIASSGTVNNGSGLIGVLNTGVGSVYVSGGTWNNTLSLAVGQVGNGTMHVESGGVVTSPYGRIGNYGGSGGTVVVTGVSGGKVSKWSNSGNLIVGNAGTGKLTISAGAEVVNTDAFIASHSGNDVGNGMVNVTGLNSTWTNMGTLTVGDEGVGTLRVDLGGTVTSSAGKIGNHGEGDVTITGSTSKWTNSDDLWVGISTAGHLTISAGAEVKNAAGLIAFSTGSISTVNVTGSVGLLTPSKWTNSETLTIGNAGNATLTINNSGRVSSAGSTIGANAPSTGKVIVTGGNGVLYSTWTNTGDMIVGDQGKGTLQISAGGKVNNLTMGTTSTVGNTGSGDGLVTIDGSDSTWSNAGGLIIGNQAKGQMDISNSGTVTSATGIVGATVNGHGVVNISSGSWVMNSGSLTIGQDATGELNISGGTVQNTAGLVGAMTNGNGIVNISGGLWKNTGDLTIAQASTQAVMNMTGGTVESVNASIADLGGSEGVVTVGANSLWTSSGNFFVGEAGKGTLIIQNGGKVTSGTTAANTAVIGLFSSSIDSSVTVKDTGSQWITAGDLAIGSIGKNSTLTISNHGVVTVQGGDVTIGALSGSSGVLQIGEGAEAGTFIANTVKGGNGNSQLVIFNHSETDYEFNPQLLGGIAVQHTGSGTTILTGDNTYTSGTSVQAGTLLIKSAPGANATGTGNVVVLSGATFGGKGMVAGSVSIFDGGTLAPGIPDTPENVAQINFLDDLSLGNTSTILIEIGEIAGTLVCDHIDIAGTSMLGGTLEIKLLPGYTPKIGDTFDAFNWNNNLDTSTAFGILPTLGNGLDWDFSDLYLGGTITVVPEPSSNTLLMLGIASFSLSAFHRRRRNAGSLPIL